MAETSIELRRLLKMPGFDLFDFDYQFDDMAFKAELEERVIDFFYDSEIAFATPDHFKRKFKARWLRAISYYNKLYNTTLLEYNPLINSKMSEALEQLATANTTQDNNTTSTGSSTSTSGATGTNDSTTTTDSDSTGSDYPQQPIAGGNYAATATANNSTQTTTGNTTNDATTESSDEGTTTTALTSNTTNNSNYTKTIEGLTGTSYQALIAAERENLLRIPNMLIDELKPCFMMVY
jgi:hypothetical protein